MGWFSWGHKEHFKIAIDKIDAWFSCIYKPHTYYDCIEFEKLRVYLFGSEQQLKDKYLEVNGSVPPWKGIAGLASVDPDGVYSIWLVVAKVDGQVVPNYHALGHELFHLIDFQEQKKGQDQYPNPDAFHKEN